MLKRLRHRFAGRDPGDTGAQLLRGGAAAILIRAAGTLVNFALVVVLARLLGTETYGVYAIVLSVLTVAAIPLQGGLASVVVREVARSGFCDNPARIRALLRWATMVIGAYSLAVALIFVTLDTLWPDLVSPARAAALGVGLLLVPALGLTNATAATLLGIRYTAVGLALDTLIRPGVLILLVLAIMPLVWPVPGAAAVMTLHTIAAATAFTVGALVLRRPLVAGPDSAGAAALGPDSRRAWRAALLPLSLVSGLQVVNSEIGVLMIGAFRTDAEAGLYRIAVQMSGLVAFGLVAITPMLAPHFSRLWADGQKEDLQRFVTLGARVTLALALVPALVFLGFGENLIGLLFGTGYLDARLPLVILALGQFANAAFGSVGALLNMTGHERDTMRGMIAALATNGVLALVLVPWLGIVGAALGTTLSYLVWNTMLRGYVRTRLGIESTAFTLRRPPPRNEP